MESAKRTRMKRQWYTIRLCDKGQLVMQTDIVPWRRLAWVMCLCPESLLAVCGLLRDTSQTQAEPYTSSENRAGQHPGTTCGLPLYQTLEDKACLLPIRFIAAQ